MSFVILSMKSGLCLPNGPYGTDKTQTGWGSIATAPLDEIATEIVNPVGGLVSLFNEFEYNSFMGSLPGADDQTKFTYTLMPSIPFSLSNGKKIVVRASLPISSSTPAYKTDKRDNADWLVRQRADTISTEKTFTAGHGHMDDIAYDLAYGGVSNKGLIFMFGIAGVLPTSQDGSIERDQYLLGPEIAIGKIYDWGIMGAWVKHLTNVANVSNSWFEIDYDTNETVLKVFFAYGLGNGWQLISNPKITYDWEGVSDNNLLLPLGGGVSKTVRISRMPMKMDFEIYNYIESPDVFGPDWMLTLSFIPVLTRWSH